MAMVNNFETKSERHRKLSKLYIEVTDCSVCSLYKENSDGKIQMLHDADKFYMVQTIDLTYICSKTYCML